MERLILGVAIGRNDRKCNKTSGFDNLIMTRHCSIISVSEAIKDEEY
jgi:hypothetical protein